jgi:hypothetical protein
MTAVLFVGLQVLCCLGLGAAGLRALGIFEDLTPGQAWAIAFALGTGLLGWLVFFPGVAGYLTAPVLVGLLVLGATGAVLLLRMVSRPEAPNRITWVLMAVALVAAGLDLAEALSPPGDTDSLAYHFSLPKKFLTDGGIEFVPRIISGASPLLVQMTYVPVLALGGERAMMLWTLISGWAAGGLLYALCRDYLGQAWSLAVAVVFLTLPAVVYGAGSGQIEMRTAMFVMVAAFATGRALEGRRASYAVLAGLAAGFFVASKYLGLFLALACGLIMLARSGWLRRGSIYAVAALVAGFQWYAWNAMHTGDPVFPMLFEWLGSPDSGYWTDEQQAAFHQYFSSMELVVPPNLFWYFAYPFKAVFDGHPVFESSITGFGPYLVIVLPFALVGAWREKRLVLAWPLSGYLFLPLLYYTFWFFISSSQRLRHLLPVLPPLLLWASVAAHRYVTGRALVRPLVAGLIVVLGIQLGGHAFFSLKFLQHLASGESREAFLTRTVSGYEAVPVLNARLTNRDRLLLSDRQYLYYLEFPYLLANQHIQAQINFLPGVRDTGAYMRQLRAQGVTHVLAFGDMTPTPRDEDPTIVWLVSAAWRDGCLKPLVSVPVTIYKSRTMPTEGQYRILRTLFRVTQKSCPHLAPGKS